MPALTAEMIQFLASGVAFQLGACSAEGRPTICRGLAARVLEDGRVMVLLSAESGFEVLAAIRETGRVALNIAAPATVRSLHLKGGDAVVSMEAGMRPLLDQFHAAFCGSLSKIGYALEFTESWFGIPEHDVAAVTFTPDRAFDQTPGPGAGNALPLRS